MMNRFIQLTQHVLRWNTEKRCDEPFSVPCMVNVSKISIFYAEETGAGPVKTRVCFDADNFRYVNETPEQIMELVNA